MGDSLGNRTEAEIAYDVAVQRKMCRVCSIQKGFNLFYNSAKAPDGKGTRCKSCDDAAREKYFSKDPERFKTKNRGAYLKFRYGIGLEEYSFLLDKQGGVCAICRSKTSRANHRLSVDHCHVTDKVRGLLCNDCNRGIGLLGDTEESLTNALNYLKGNNAIH